MQLPEGQLLVLSAQISATSGTAAAAGAATQRAPGFGLRFDDKHRTDLQLLDAMAGSQAPQQRTDQVARVPALLFRPSGERELTSVAPLAHQDLTAAALGADSAAGTRELEALTESDEVSAEHLTRARAELESPTDDRPRRAVKGSHDSIPIIEGPGDDSIPIVEGTSDAIPVIDSSSAALAHAASWDPSLLDSDEHALEELTDAAPPAEPPPSPPPEPPPPSPEPGALRGAGEPAIFGVDFGTSYCSIALVRDQQLEIVVDNEGSPLLPTAVCFPERGGPLVGWPARAQLATHPSTTFTSPKRLLGRRYDDALITPLLESLPIRFSSGPNGDIIADVYGDPVAMPQICTEVFRRLARTAEERTQTEVKRVVLSAPVGYGKRQRRALRRAAELARLEVVAMLDEPVSAALAYGVGRQSDELVAVYDFGGGTFDFTVITVADNQFQVIEVAGDPWLGGDDFDRTLANAAADHFWRKTRVDLRDREVEWQRLLFVAEDAKRKLSYRPQVEMVLRGAALSIRGQLDLRMRLDRARFEELCGELVERSLGVVDDCLQRVGKSPADIAQVVMTGGVSRIPLVRKHVGDYFGREIEHTVDPEQAVVIGNTIYAHHLSRSGVNSTA